nr:MAG TPA: hypothetical protein [Caudoviricetes sp.]
MRPNGRRISRCSPPQGRTIWTRRSASNWRWRCCGW